MNQYPLNREDFELMERTKTEFEQTIVGCANGQQILSGSGEIFNHVDEDKPMWSGVGYRQARRNVLFVRPFKKPPVISLFLSGLDASELQNTRINIYIESILENGFVICAFTWGGSKVARACASWMAVGRADQTGRVHMDSTESNNS